MPGQVECCSGEPAKNGKLSGSAGHLCRTRWRLPASLGNLTVAVNRVKSAAVREPRAGLTRQLTCVATVGAAATRPERRLVQRLSRTLKDRALPQALAGLAVRPRRTTA